MKLILYLLPKNTVDSQVYSCMKSTKRSGDEHHDKKQGVI